MRLLLSSLMPIMRISHFYRDSDSCILSKETESESDENGVSLSRDSHSFSKTNGKSRSIFGETRMSRRIKCPRIGFSWKRFQNMRRSSIPKQCSRSFLSLSKIHILNLIDNMKKQYIPFSQVRTAVEDSTGGGCIYAVNKTQYEELIRLE